MHSNSQNPNNLARELLLHAKDEPMLGIEPLGTHQRYRYPHLSIRPRHLNALANNHLRIKMAYAGICGTDLHLVQSDPHTGYIRSSAPAHIPPAGRIIGHEGVGQVLECGKNCADISPGDWVCFESIITCRYCPACRRGNFNQCQNARLLGMEEDGLFGTVVDLPASLAHVVSDLAETPDRLAATACIEPAGVAWLALESAHIAGGDHLLIFGGGPIGQYCAMLARLFFGAARIILVDQVARRRELALAWCDEAYSPEQFSQSIDLTCDIMIDTSGHLDYVKNSFRKINANGKVILIARNGMPLQIDAIDHMITNAIKIQGVRGHLGGGFERILSLYRADKLPLEKIITRTLPNLETLLEWLQKPEQIAQEECKVLVRLN